MPFQRPVVAEIVAALARRPPLVQVLVGARQVGKSTAAAHVADRLGWPAHSASADAAIPHGPEWVQVQWRIARLKARETRRRVLLVLDEIQKVPGWSEEVKRLWDEEVRDGGRVRPLILGSSALLVQRGLTESLAGRFYLHRCTHWPFAECRDAFGWNLEQWLYYGGYPGAAPLVSEPAVWKRYVTDSLIETVLARDVLQLQPITKPALLRQLFALATQYPAQVLSYNKMLGQLQDAGNTVTLASYLRTLESAFLASGLDRYSGSQVRTRGSSPKLILWNNALISASSGRSFEAAIADGGWWGSLVENAVGARLLGELTGPEWTVSYWRARQDEVDFVVARGTETWAIEVKSDRALKASGLGAFTRLYPKAGPLIVGASGVPLAEFLDGNADRWFR